MKPIKTLIEEETKKFKEYMAMGYGGGESGLRCTICDSKYSGESGMIQLCPRCRARESFERIAKATADELEAKYYDEKNDGIWPYDGIMAHNDLVNLQKAKRDKFFKK